MYTWKQIERITTNFIASHQEESLKSDHYPWSKDGERGLVEGGCELCVSGCVLVQAYQHI